MWILIHLEWILEIHIWHLSKHIPLQVILLLPFLSRKGIKIWLWDRWTPVWYLYCRTRLCDTISDKAFGLLTHPVLGFWWAQSARETTFLNLTLAEIDWAAGQSFCKQSLGFSKGKVCAGQQGFTINVRGQASSARWLNQGVERHGASCQPCSSVVDYPAHCCSGVLSRCWFILSVHRVSLKREDPPSI